MFAPQHDKQETWIDRIVRSTKNLESPERYFWWSAISAISAVVRKRVFLDRAGHYKLYPNVYVALISKHSGLRKGVPVSLVAKLINEVNCTRVIEGRNSIQSVIQEFSRQVALEDGLVLSDAQGILISGEFDTMLVKDPDALTILTALYNTHEHGGKWKNTLKGSGVESLKNPCISLLVASNETLFNNVVKEKDIEGGFMARTFIVMESKRRTINDLIDADPNIIDVETLVRELKEISKIEGEFVWSKGAKELYRPWYRELSEAEFDDRTGSVDRLGDSVLKVAMLLNLAGERDLVLSEDNILLSIQKCQECLSGIRQITRSSGISELAPQAKKIIDKLLSAPGNTLSRKKLLQRVWPDVDAMTLDRILETMTEAGHVDAIRDPSNQPAYRLTKTAVEQFNRFIEEERERDM